MYINKLYSFEQDQIKQSNFKIPRKSMPNRNKTFFNLDCFISVNAYAYTNEIIVFF